MIRSFFFYIYRISFNPHHSRPPSTSDGISGNQQAAQQVGRIEKTITIIRREKTIIINKNTNSKKKILLRIRFDRIEKEENPFTAAAEK